MSVRAPMSRETRVIQGLMLVAPLLFLASLVLSNQVSAVDPTTTPLIVFGYVYDEAGQPLQGADVVVTDLITSSSVESDPTLSTGFYTATLGVGTWGIGHAIQIAVTAPGGAQASRTAPANDSDFLFLDVHFPTAIPQLGGPVGFAVAAGLLGVVAVVAVGVRRRKPQI